MKAVFQVGFIKQPDRHKRQGYKTGYQVWYEFAVTQGVRSLSTLENLQRFFGVGKLYLNKRYDNHKQHPYRYVVRKREDLENVIIPFFLTYNLRTAKKDDFQKFVICMSMIRDGKHITREGIMRIALITQTMNRQKSKQSLIEILRDYTPDARIPTGKDIVPPA